MATNDFKAFATAVGANVASQADYVASSYRPDGFAAGIAESDKLNKVWRQAAFIAAMVAQFVVDVSGNDMLDDGDLNAKIALFTAAVQVSAGIRPSALVTTSIPRTVLASEYAIGFARVAAPAATAVTLPADAAVGQEFVIEDVASNAFTYNITVSPPAGHTIAGLANFTLNTDRQSQGFRFYGGTTWSLTT